MVTYMKEITSSADSGEKQVRITVSITDQGTTIESEGRVAYSIAGAGMGLHFENAPAGSLPLDRLLTLLSNEFEQVRERVTISEQKLVLVLFVLLLAAAAAGTLVSLGLLH
jgi:hypothetical protein